MKRKFTFLSAALMLLAFLAVPLGMRGQSDYSTDYTGNVTLSTTGGSNASDCTINISNTDYNGIKAGTSSKTGAVMITVPSGTKYLHLHAAAWNNTTVSLAVTPTSYSDNILLTANSGISGNSPFTFSGNASTSDYYKVITFSSALTANTDLTFTAVGGKRFVIWGVTAEAEGGSGTQNPSITADNVEIAYDATSGSIEYTINNPTSDGQLAASTTADWLTLGTVGVTVPFTCSANQTSAARTATVVLTYTYNTDQTKTKNVTVTQAANPNAVNSISDITAAGSYTVQGTIVAKSQRGFIVGDGTGYAYYYNSNYTQADYNIGDMVKLAGSVIVYGGVFEFNNSTTITTATSSNYVTEAPTVLSGADMDARVASTTPPLLSNYIQFEGTLAVSSTGNNTHYNITNIAGATTAIGSISYPLNSTEVTALDGKYVQVTGYYVGISTGTYYNVMLGGIEEIATDNPSITAENVSIDYNATNGTITYSIENPVSDGVLTAVTESDWLTLGSVGATVPFTCTANTTASARTATVTLTYTYNTDQIINKNVTVTQTGNPNTVDNISDITAAGNYTVQGTIVAINNRGFIVGDGTGYVYYFNNTSDFDPADYSIGDMVKLAGSVVVYGGVFEFNSSTTITYVSESNYEEEEPTVLSGAEMDTRVASTTPQLSSYVQYEGMLTVSGTYYNITNIAGAQTAKGSISSPLDTEFTSLNGKQVKVIGYYVGVSSSQYYNTMIGSIEEVTNTTPSVTVTPATINAPAEGADGTLAITYENIPELISFDIQFCDANGNELLDTVPDWIDAEIQEEDDVHSVYYVIGANDGDARTAYFKVYTFAGDELEEVYAIVTVNQAEYVAPSIATLPFEFNGGRDDIANTDGLTHEGLGTDYNASTAPNTRLKFDGTGDWMLLHFNEEPGTLTFDIKGNGFSGGTFTVQTSEDGVTYTDLAAYTELGETDTKTFDNLDENIRYIKWIYTEKSSGNVGLGNIILYEFGGGPVPEASITVDPDIVNTDADEHDGTLSLTYANLEITDMTDFDVQYFDAESEAAEEPEWIEVVVAEQDPTVGEGYVVSYFMLANEGEARTVYFKVYAMDAETNLVYSNLVTINQAAYVAPSADYAELPFEFNGGRADIDNTEGLTAEGLGTDYNATTAPTTKLKFDNAGDWMLLHFDEVPGPLSFNIKGNGFSGGTFTVQTSEDGITYTDLAAYTDLGDETTKTFDNLNENVRYIKWIYTEKSSGNVGLGNIYLYEFGGGPVIETYDLTIAPFENLEIFTFVGGNENEMALDGAGTIQVAEGDQVMLSVSAEEGYVMQSLMVDGVEHVNDIDDDLTYIFNMPDHNVTVNATAVADVPFEPVTYTLATTIESGKTYIIVGSKTIDNETYYYAMGEQKDKNRGGVEINVDGTTATVTSDAVYEFVITALESEGFYSIYDERTPGYLYAASNSANQLKTETELDTVGNGNWAISFDTVCSIVASNINNRNVMQFNYNGGNTLFSCYASASQSTSPVYLYVKDEVPTTATQTIALAGSTYVSFRVEVTLDELKAALVEALPGTSITIQGKTQSAKYTGSRWTGQLRVLDVSQLYIIKVESSCEIELEGMPVDPAEHPITIVNGNNYIAYPFNETMSVANAFAGFAVSGDKLQSKTQNASYNGTRWTGQLRNLEPGQGYIYKSATTEARTFTFPDGAK